MNCQYSSCFLLIQLLITALGTFADMARAGSGSISRYEEPSLATINSYCKYLIKN